MRNGGAVRDHPWRDRNLTGPPRSGRRSSPSVIIPGGIATRAVLTADGPGDESVIIPGGIATRPDRRCPVGGAHESVIIPGGIATCASCGGRVWRPGRDHPWRDRNKRTAPTMCAAWTP